jgi:hypothetical protein
MNMPDRYTGKPFLRLLDCYVMDAIGVLDPEDDAMLTRAEPKFHKMFHTTGKWRQIVETRMNFPAGMKGAVKELWEKGRPRFKEKHGYEPNPWDFTVHFIDTNFPH